MDTHPPLQRKAVRYSHLVTEGTHYEVGRALGAHHKHHPAMLAFMSSPFMGAAPLLPSAAEKAMESFQKYCPGLNEEIQGFADETGIAAADVVFYYAYFQPSGHCTQAAYRTGAASGKRSHTYHMRNYDFGWEDEPYNQLLLSTTRVKGKPAHIGFALQLFGRYDGMNEEGLTVTTTSGRMRPEMSGEGFVFPGVVRTLLDHCATTEEAVSLMRDMPISDYRNFLISDAAGNVALIETAGMDKEIQTSPAGSAGQLILSANHYTLPSMQAHNQQVMENSRKRYEVLQSALAGGSMTNNPVDAMKAAAGLEYPQGICCHHYNEGFGTLWSMVCDNTAREAHICFGSPQLNGWRTFGFHDPAGLREYEAVLPDRPSAAGFWDHVR
ncbi:C45 family autoproteolytic acyltransferase/hydolase [Paenibacillus piscarius]|uniref:C45 family autoproteolytic acyltransferase/hydolase n=1 Tax=Paenibacillus piscarius TaxID=1089681 RepID=UPI001EE7E1A8|nr:C45 family peptidase [Paenibacillus piscarius]